MAVTLYVWRLRPENPGHVSLQVDGTYMSYWPDGAAGKNDIKLGSTHEAVFPRSYATDCRLERRGADVNRALVGLQDQRMIETWEEFRLNPRRYNMVAHNCSTLIAVVLEAGSGISPSFVPRIQIDDHATNWATRLFLRLRYFGSSIRMWTPDAVLQYAEELAHGQQRR